MEQNFHLPLSRNCVKLYRKKTFKVWCIRNNFLL